MIDVLFKSNKLPYNYIANTLKKRFKANGLNIPT